MLGASCVKKIRGFYSVRRMTFSANTYCWLRSMLRNGAKHSFLICEYFLFANWSTLLVDVTGWPRCISKKPSPSLTLCWATFAEYWRCESREFTSTLTLVCQAAWWPSHSWKVVQEFRKVPHWSYISPVCWHIFFITRLMNGTSLHLNSKFSLFSLMCFA